MISCHCSFQIHFLHHSVHFNFIKLCLYTKERIPNRIPFSACRNSKYFKFYGTLNFSWNRMSCLFLSPSSHSSPDFWQLYNRGTSMKLGNQLPNNIPHKNVLEKSRLLEKPRKKCKFSLFFNLYELSRFSTNRRMRTGVCLLFERFIINQASSMKLCL